MWDHPSSIGVNLLYTNYVPCLYGRSHIITHGPAAHPPLIFEISSDLPDSKGGRRKRGPSYHNHLIHESREHSYQLRSRMELPPISGDIANANLEAITRDIGGRYRDVQVSQSHYLLTTTILLFQYTMILTLYICRFQFLTLLHV